MSEPGDTTQTEKGTRRVRYMKRRRGRRRHSSNRARNMALVIVAAVIACGIILLFWWGYNHQIDTPTTVQPWQDVRHQ